MNGNRKRENEPAENQHLSAALAQMPEAEVVQLLNIIGALQADLLRLAPLFIGQELVEAVAHTQDLLNILSDEIGQFLALKQATITRSHAQNPDIEGVRVDYAPVHRLLSKFHGGKRRLVWAEA